MEYPPMISTFKEFSFVFLFLLLLSLPLRSQTTAVAPIGSGTEADPYQISTLGHLSWIAQTPTAMDKHFIQTSNINAFETQFWDDSDDNIDGDLFNDDNDANSTGTNQGFSPIGVDANRFSGIYDGNGHLITDLYINRPTMNFVGFIGYNQSGSELKKLGLQDVDIVGSNVTGSLVGRNLGTINQCYSTGAVAAPILLGGITGANYGSINNSYSRVVTTGNGTQGGLSGENANNNITYSYSTGEVRSSGFSGGLNGYVDFGPYSLSTSFWDTETSNKSTSQGGVGKTTAEMKQEITFTTVGWDFTDIWKIDNINNDGYPYLQWQQFDPIVRTDQISERTSTTVIANGNLLNLDNPNINEYGFAWSTTENTTIADNKTVITDAIALGEFSANITGLTENTTYYLRAYAGDGTDAFYGEEISFSTDVTAPSPSLQNVSDMVNGPFVLELVFDEPITDLAPNPVEVAPAINGRGTATLGELITITEGLEYTLEVTPTVEGELIFFNEFIGMARDLAGNDSNPLVEISVIYDATRPILNIHNPQTEVNGLFTLQLQSNEPITQLAPSPILVNLDAFGNPMASLGTLVEVVEGREYTLEVTPLIEGELQFFNDNIDVARDLAGNPSLPIETVLIQYIDLDRDNDGVPNTMDQCANTTSGAQVNPWGCETISLSSDNFMVEAIGTSCIGMANGAIAISAKNQDFDYRTIVNGEEVFVLTSSTYSQTLHGLEKGIYEVCFRIAEKEGYEQCFEVAVTEPQSLQAISSMDIGNKRLSLSLMGSGSYNVTLNGDMNVYTEQELSLTLKAGMNTLKVNTGLDCQGVYEEEIFVSEAPTFYPNPTPGPLSIIVPGTDLEIAIRITMVDGSLVQESSYGITGDRHIGLNLENLSPAVYMVYLEGKTLKHSFKILKQ
ncbi:T9SS C-terminal target domain-containing protein [Ulvibacterium marinum]|uniref:T9SS C-terminal target domain-containing protein n=2 Tax=Ulvibacterium marinum TaxID=2419782 RepID=A0A3B0C861_9FLAO|nr:T9SS C-terminal target domain-containing protein [Ulvibacterium marinum]